MQSNLVQFSLSLVHYQVFLLRQWQEQDLSGEHLPVWRFMLENPLTGARRGFGSVGDLAAFLEEQIAAISRQSNSHTKETS